MWGLMSIEFHRDGPWDVPEGWVWARLGDVLPVDGQEVAQPCQKPMRVRGQPEAIRWIVPEE